MVTIAGVFFPSNFIYGTTSPRQFACSKLMPRNPGRHALHTQQVSFQSIRTGKQQQQVVYSSTSGKKEGGKERYGHTLGIRVDRRCRKHKARAGRLLDFCYRLPDHRAETAPSSSSSSWAHRHRRHCALPRCCSCYYYSYSFELKNHCLSSTAAASTERSCAVTR